MSVLEKYQVGINLGGWISQYVRNDNKETHFETFITENDIKRIASWGMDHVRLPFDYDILEDDNSPFNYKFEGLDYIDKCIDWCKKHGLNVILDFHRAPGQTHNYNLPVNPLLADSANEMRYLGIWSYLAKRYINVSEGLIFELLNEIVDPTDYMWNRLVDKAISVIRSIDQNRVIMVGGNKFNSVFNLKELKLYDDPNIVYTFHFYEPVPFTHQQAHFVKFTRYYDKIVNYPGDFNGLRQILEEKPSYVDDYGKYCWYKNDRKLVSMYLEDAYKFLKYTGKELYCGEFGCINVTPEASKVNWLNDVIEIFNENRIGRAFWTYKELDFGLLDIHGKAFNEELIGIISKR